MKRFYFLLISFLTLSFIVIAQVKMFVHQSNGNIVEILASRVDSISLLFPSKEEPDDPDVPVEPVFYTISFDANGGTGTLSSEELEENKTYVIPSNVFIREGYKFIGWNTKSNGTGVSYTDGQNIIINNDLTLYAQWEEVLKLETIVLSAEQIDDTNQVRVVAECSITPQRIVWFSKTENGTYREIQGENNNVLIITPEPSAYTYVKANMVTKSDEVVESLPIIISSTCLSVVFNEDFGTFERETDRTSTPHIGPEYTYVDGCNALQEEGTYAVMVNPKFAGNSPLIGSGSNSCEISGTLWYRDIYDHTQSGLENDRWGGLLMVNADAELVYSREVDVTPNTLMIYSAWVAYASNQDDGNGDVFNSEITFVVRDTRGRELVEMPLRLEGSDKGWQKGEVVFNTEENSVVTIELYNYNRGGDGNDFVIDDISFTICDEQNIGIIKPTSISFNANGGVGNMNTEQINPLVYYTLPSNKFIKENYFFTGWNTKADGTGESFKDVQGIYKKESFTLYAQWVKGVTVSFHANGGAGTMESKFIDPTKSYKLPDNTFTKEDYFYNGWNTASDGTGESFKDVQSIYTKESITLYAQWVKGVTVSFHANGGIGTMESKYIDPTKSYKLPDNTFTKEDYFYNGWNTVSDGTGIAYSDAQTTYITEDLTLYAQWEEFLISSGTENGYEYVDLGLPSGIKWATVNVGAESPEDYGDYFAWGETTTKSTYDWDTYKWCEGDYDTQTKYCTDSYYGTVDNKTVLDLADDAANANWHSDWRMPTNAEQDELRTECTWAWGTLNGVKGCKVTSKTNGNSIFLPATGYRYYNYLYHEEVYGHYWSNTLYTRPNYAYNLCFYSGSNMFYYEEYRYEGHSIRPVIRVKETYTLTFNANNGEGTMPTIKAKEDEQISIPSNTFTRPTHKFIGWNTKADGTGVSYSADQTITLTENLTLYAQWKAFEMSGIENGYGYVDLGLPSGTKWAIMNIGAESPEEYGDYFAWGETQPKSSYTWSSYKHMTAGKSSWEYVNKYTYADAQTSGVWYSGSTFIGDNKKTLDTTDDVARVKYGANWRMPTKAEIDELHSKCTWSWTTQDGVRGYKVTSKTNGNSIFLPAAGYKEDSSVNSTSTAGNYWSKTIGSSYSDYAYFLSFSSSSITITDKSRSRGNSVRAVLPVLLNITLKANGGEGTMPNIDSDFGSSVTLPTNTFTRQGYAFIGWNTKADGSGTSYLAGETITLTENITLYAQWGEPSYLYFVNTSNWTNIYAYVWTGTSNNYVYWPGEPAKKENFTINGYDVYSYNMSDKKLYDNIIFNGLGTNSSFRDQTDDLSVDYSTPYFYDGNWYDSIDAITKMTLTLDGNGSESTISPIYVEYGSTVTLSECLSTRSGYRFIGWNTQADGTGTSYAVGQTILIKQNITLYAQWQKVFTVSFNANGGSGTMPAVELAIDESFNIPSSTFIYSINEFLGWNTKPDGSGNEYTIGQTITITEDITLYAQWKLLVGTENGHEWVDLGLPSKTKWATMNVGATSPEGYGSYYAWGETRTKASYHDTNYTYSGNSEVLSLSNDAAFVNWGGKWEMPTKSQQDELQDTKYCTWTWTTLNGVKGYRVTSKTNGNSIFLPAAGYRYNSYSNFIGENGYYWSSSSAGSSSAYYMEFNNFGVGWDYYNDEFYGKSVRPVLSTEYEIKFHANGGEGTMQTLKIDEHGSFIVPSNEFIYSVNEFLCWNTKPDGSGNEYTIGQTITIIEDITLYAQWKILVGTENGHEWVDLGLPSGTKWATCNVGADSPEKYGDYFAWGETKTKSSYDWSTYKWGNYIYDLTKYCINPKYGEVDNKTTLDLSDDAAYVNWGNSWRMPTFAEQDELSNTSYTTWTWTTQNGVKGYKVTSKTNGNSIFLPAAGYRRDSDLYNAGSSGYYWSSSLDTLRPCDANYLSFNSGNVYSGDDDRSYGLSVRPVLAK